MQINRFCVNMIQENCYLVWDETRQAALIDCGAYYDEERKAISSIVAEKNLTLTHLFNTHAHFDHLFGASYIYKEYGVKIELCAAEQETYAQAAKFMTNDLHLNLSLELPPVGRWFNDGDKLSFGNTTFEVIATPGHTPGGVCFYCKEDNVLFTGDSLFRQGIGRCDFPGGNETQLVHALKTRILTLPDCVQVLPGHGDISTIAEENRTFMY